MTTVAAAVGRGPAQRCLPGRVAVVTGGSGGIGAATACALARQSRRVAVGYHRSLEAAEAVCASISSTGGTATPVYLPAADASAIDEAFSSIEQRWGPVEIVVCAAGITRDRLAIQLRDSDWDDVVQTNLTGPFLVARRALRSMVRQRWGRIVFVSSVVASTGSGGQANYAAAKAGLVGLSRSLAREVATRAVTVNVVEPGPIATAMTDALSDSRRAELAARTALGRFGEPSEAAAAIAFLCADDASYVTGTVLPVDGGLGMGR